MAALSEPVTYQQVGEATGLSSPKSALSEQPSKQPDEPLTGEDAFRQAGGMLSFAKGERLDNIVYYVRRIAGFSDLTEIWNALKWWDITPRNKCIWLELFRALAMPWVDMPPGIREQCDRGFNLIGDRSIVEDSIAPKPTQFSVIGGEIMGDPESDLTFSQALEELKEEQKRR